MKLLTLLFFCNSIFCQTSKVSGHVVLNGTTSDYEYMYVFIKHNDSIISGSEVNNKGNFEVKSEIKYGNYILKIEQLGSRPYFQDLVLDKDSVFLNLDYTCPFLPKGEKPKCINGHTDYIIPTKYGLPSDKMMRKAKRGKIHLGGCETYGDGCNSYSFCTLHNKEL